MKGLIEKNLRIDEVARVNAGLGAFLKTIDEPSSTPGYLDPAEVEAIRVDDPEFYAAWKMASEAIAERGTHPRHIDAYASEMEDRLRTYDRPYATKAGLVDQHKIEKLSGEQIAALEEAAAQVESIRKKEGDELAIGTISSALAFMGVAALAPPAGASLFVLWMGLTVAAERVGVIRRGFMAVGRALQSLFR